MWSKDKFAKVTIKRASGHGNAAETKIDVVFDKQTKNVLGRLPGTYYQRDTSIDYPIRTNLPLQSIEWNVSFSDLKTAAATQGHGQLVLKHPEGQPIKEAHMGMFTALALPQSKKADAAETTADYISASPDLAGQLEVLKFDLSNILDEQQIKAKGTIEGGVERFASGFDRLLSEADVQDVIEENQSMYAATIEQGVFDTLSAYEKAMQKNTFAKTEDLTVYFEKPKVLISDKETIDNIKARDEIGLSLDHEKHMVINPNLSEDDALEREVEIQEQKKKKQKEAVALMQESEDPEDESDAIKKKASPFGKKGALEE